MESCLLSPTDTHNYVAWSIYWMKCKYCGKIQPTEDVDHTTIATNSTTPIDTRDYGESCERKG